MYWTNWWKKKKLETLGHSTFCICKESSIFVVHLFWLCSFYDYFSDLTVFFPRYGTFHSLSHWPDIFTTWVQINNNNILRGQTRASHTFCCRRFLVMGVGVCAMCYVCVCSFFACQSHARTSKLYKYFIK